MTRDMDLVRTLLLGMEDPLFDGVRQVRPDPGGGELGVTDANHVQVAYHLTLLVEEGFIEGVPGSLMPIVSRLTWKGHEFLDAVRDEDTWGRTKAVSRSAGTWGLDALLGIAKEVGKAKIGKVLGGMFGG